jgi:hypothetical protein
LRVVVVCMMGRVGVLDFKRRPRQLPESALRKRLGRAFVAALLLAFFVFLVQLALGRL